MVQGNGGFEVVTERQAFDKSRFFDATIDTLRFGEPVDVTIASNAINVSSSNHNITATGTLNTIDHWDAQGMMILLTADATVTIAHNSDNIQCWNAANITLTSTGLVLLFKPDPTSNNFFAIGDVFSSSSHTRSHTVTNTSDHTATADRFFISDNSGNVIEIALGADGTVLLGKGTTTSPAFGKVDLTADVENDLPVAEGGTGASTAQAAIDTLSAVSGATNEHVLTKDTGTGNATFKAAAGGAVATDVIWDAKGDLAGGTGSDTAVKLTVGSNDQVLTAASGETTGMKWAAAAGGGFDEVDLWIAGVFGA